MGIDFRSKFDELFGEEEAQMSAPTLRDVAPSLVDRGGSRFSSKELNPRRTAVSARNFRNPRVRSKEGAFERGGAVAQGGSFGPVSNDNNNFYQGAVAREMNEVGLGPGGGIGGTGVEGGNAFGGNIGGELGTAMGNAAATSMGISGLGSAALGAAGALGLGASLGQAASFGLGQGVMGALGMTGPLGALGMANSIGGSVAAGVVGSNAASSLGMSPTGPAAVAGFDAASSHAGLVGMGAKGLASLFGFSQSPSNAAVEAALSSEQAQSIGIHGSEDPSAAAAAIGLGEHGTAIAAAQSLGQQASVSAAADAAEGTDQGGFSGLGIGNPGSYGGSNGEGPGTAAGDSVGGNTGAEGPGFGGAGSPGVAGSGMGGSVGGATGAEGPGFGGAGVGAGGGGACCFTSGTQILMSDSTSKNIEDVKIGDVVKSFNPSTERYCDRNVISLESPVREGYYAVTMEDDHKVNVTNEHPLYSSKGWVSIDPNMTRELDQSGVSVVPMEVGMKLLTLDGLKKIESIKYNEGDVQVYTLNHVDIDHTFFADGVLAHNGK